MLETHFHILAALIGFFVAGPIAGIFLESLLTPKHSEPWAHLDLTDHEQAKMHPAYNGHADVIVDDWKGPIRPWEASGGNA